MANKQAEAENQAVCPIQHIAFIMDGNGRWAKKRGMPREYGHKFGADAFKKVMRRCCEVGIKASTFYVFSTENWKRPEKEVNSILSLLDQYLDECERELEKNDVRFIFLGDKAPFTEGMRKKMECIEQVSLKNQYIINIALNYGGRDELVYAMNRLMAEGRTKVEESDINNALYTHESPELDMIVRTGGDLRISNFLLWQAAYAELYFMDKLWPDMKADDVDEIVEVFKTRKRRFGGV